MENGTDPTLTAVSQNVLGQLTFGEKIAHAAWACADPGLQYDTTINERYTCPEGGLTPLTPVRNICSLMIPLAT